MAYENTGRPMSAVAPNPLVEAQRPGFCARALYPKSDGRGGWINVWQWCAVGGGFTEDIGAARVFAARWEAVSHVRWIKPSEVTTVPRHNGHCREWIVEWTSDEDEITQEFP